MSDGFNSVAILVPTTSLCWPAFALDIGGSLAKLSYVTTCTQNENDCRDGKMTLHLVTFTVREMDKCLQFIKRNVLGQGQVTVKGYATGVGSVKYREEITKTLGLSLTPDCQEMLHATRGLHYLWRNLDVDRLLLPGLDHRDLIFHTDITKSNLLPCILVNLGSAMTIIKIGADGKMQNIVGGSVLAGQSLLGLGALLTKAKTFCELIALAERGDNKKVDLLVADTAGTEYNFCPQESMVSSFGRAATLNTHGQDVTFAEEDLANSLVKAITDNLAAAAFYVARAESVKYACFCGSYISGKEIIVNTIVKKLREASAFLQHDVHPVFLQHEAYLGSLGALASISDQVVVNH